MPEGAARASFIVRISRDETGGVSGVIENVRTGEKERVHGTDGIGPVIARMVAHSLDAGQHGREAGLQGNRGAEPGDRHQ